MENAVAVNKSFKNLIDNGDDEVTIGDYLKSLDIHVIIPLEYLHHELEGLTAYGSPWSEKCHANHANKAVGLMALFKNVLIVLDQLNEEACRAKA